MDEDDKERALDQIARERGVVRDPVAERMAHELGLVLRHEALALDDTEWSRVVDLVKRLGPVDKVIAWTAANEGLHSAVGGLAKAKLIHGHLASHVLDAFIAKMS